MSEILHIACTKIDENYTLQNLKFIHEQHLFSCVNPLLLCYRVLNMGRFFFFFFCHFYVFDRKFDKGHSHLTKWNFDCCDFIIPYKILWDWFCKQAVPLLKIWKIRFFFSFKNVEELTCQSPASCLKTTTHIWRHYDVTLWTTTLTSKEQIYINALCRVRS